MKYLFITIAVLVIFVLSEAVRFVVLIERASEVIATSTQYTRTLEGSSKRILVIGDSTAIGIGASSPADSIAGRIGSLHPNSSIVNEGENGLRVKGLVRKLEDIKEGKFDLVVLQISGNDVLRFTQIRKFEEDLRRALVLSSELVKEDGKVVVMSTGDVGTAPAFSYLFQKLYSWRFNLIRETIITTTQKEQVIFVDLYYPRENDPFLKKPEKYYSKDKLHPSSEGYGVWFEKLQEAL